MESFEEFVEARPSLAFEDAAFKRMMYDAHIRANSFTVDSSAAAPSPAPHHTLRRDALERLPSLFSDEPSVGTAFLSIVEDDEEGGSTGGGGGDDHKKAEISADEGEIELPPTRYMSFETPAGGVPAPSLESTAAVAAASVGRGAQDYGASGFTSLPPRVTFNEGQMYAPGDKRATAPHNTGASAGPHAYESLSASSALTQRLATLMTNDNASFSIPLQTGSGGAAGGTVDPVVDKSVIILTCAARGDLSALRACLDTLPHGSAAAVVRKGDVDDRTALHLAAKGGHLDMVRFLVDECDADVNATDRWGNSPLSEALAAKQVGVVAFLQMSGGILTGHAAGVVAPSSSGGAGVVVDGPEDDASVSGSTATRRGAASSTSLPSHLPSSGDLNNAAAAGAGGGAQAERSRALFNQRHGEYVTMSSSSRAMELMQAANKGDLEQLQSLLLCGYDVNVCDSHHRTALHIASCVGKMRVVEFLVECGAEVDVKDGFGITPVMDAAHAGHEDVVTFLLKHGGKPWARRRPHEGGTGGPSILTPTADNLHLAVTWGRLSTVKAILENTGASVNAPDYDDRTPLHLAASAGHIAIVRYLLSRPDVDLQARDRRRMTPLLHAQLGRHEETVSVLEEAHRNAADAVVAAGGSMVGADGSLRRGGGETEGGGGRNAGAVLELLQAAASNSVQGVCSVLDRGVDVQSVLFDRRTALHIAADFGHVAVVETLLSRGASANVVDSWNLTPLDCASQRMSSTHRQCVHVLLQRTKLPLASTQLDRPELREAALHEALEVGSSVTALGAGEGDGVVSPDEPAPPAFINAAVPRHSLLLTTLQLDEACNDTTAPCCSRFERSIVDAWHRTFKQLVAQLLVESGFEYGEVWVPADDGVTLEPCDACSCVQMRVGDPSALTTAEQERLDGLKRFRRTSRALLCDTSDRDIGVAFTSLEPVVLLDIPRLRQPVFARAPLARRCGVRSMITVPLLGFGHTPIGVVELFSTQCCATTPVPAAPLVVTTGDPAVDLVFVYADAPGAVRTETPAETAAAAEVLSGGNKINNLQGGGAPSGSDGTGDRATRRSEEATSVLSLASALLLKGRIVSELFTAQLKLRRDDIGLIEYSRCVEANLNQSCQLPFSTSAPLLRLVFDLDLFALPFAWAATMSSTEHRAASNALSALATNAKRLAHCGLFEPIRERLVASIEFLWCVSPRVLNEHTPVLPRCTELFEHLIRDGYVSRMPTEGSLYAPSSQRRSPVMRLARDHFDELVAEWEKLDPAVVAAVDAGAELDPEYPPELFHWDLFSVVGSDHQMPRDAREVERLQEAQMAEMTRILRDEEGVMTRRNIFSLHRVLNVNNGEAQVGESELRRQCVVGSFQFYKFYRTFSPWEEIDLALDELLTMMHSAEMSRRHPVFQAFYAFSTLIFFLHPFEDGNGRLCRMLANIILKRAGYPFVITYLDKVITFRDYISKLHGMVR